MLTDLLAAEHAAIYGYGVLGARLDGRPAQLALRAYDAHRSRRNALETALRARSLTPPTTAAAYDVRCQTGLEPSRWRSGSRPTSACSGATWSAPRTTPPCAALATTGLQASAVQLVQWRRVLDSQRTP